MLNLKKLLTMTLVSLATTSETLTEGITITRCGRLRILKINKSLSAAAIVTLPTADRPIVQTNGAGRVLYNTKYYPALLTLTNGGNLSASYFDSGTTTVGGLTSGTLIAELVYVV